MAYRSAAYAHLAAIMIVVLCFASYSVGRVRADDFCTASGLATGVNVCLEKSTDKDSCCDYLINDIVVPCGITEVCGLELGADVLEFFSYCRFKCHGLLPRLSADV